MVARMHWSSGNMLTELVWYTSNSQAYLTTSNLHQNSLAGISLSPQTRNNTLVSGNSITKIGGCGDWPK